ncbi:MAG: 4Fe-4S dicluster domain-containing protein [Syntrophobacteraceae bacterium]
MRGSTTATNHSHSKAVLDARQLEALLARIQSDGFAVVGPTIRSDAIDYAVIESVNDLPYGWTEEHAPGSCRLVQAESRLAFQHTVGPTPWKRFLIPDDLVCWRASRTEEGFTIECPPSDNEKYAFWGIRSCDLHALAALDQIFLGKPLLHPPGTFRAVEGAFPDPTYKERREDLLIVAFHCGWPGQTCFCTSLGTGPRASGGFDLAFLELTLEEEVLYVGETGSERGERLLSDLNADAPSALVIQAAEQAHDRAAHAVQRTLEADGLRDVLYRRIDAPRWQETARRCFTCGNCTLVCPTCFCSTLLDSTDLSGRAAERVRRWDSCFSVEFSYLHGGGSIRTSPASRYRHWIMHKLATWWDQFSVSGCVGCGRCITWCPAGIDITEEARILRESDRRQAPTPEEACHAPV